MATSTQQSGHKLKVAMLDPMGNYAGWSREVAELNLAWDFIRFDATESLLDACDEQMFDVVFLTCSMRAQSELDLMSQMATRQNSAIRIFLGSEFWNAAQRAKASDLAHRIFSRGDTLANIAETAQYLAKITRLLNRSSLQDYVMQLGCLPSPPRIYRQLTEAIYSETADLTLISEIIELDPAIVALIMKQVNSAFFGFGREISSLKEAITLLGVRNLRSLALSCQLSQQFSAGEGWEPFSFEQQNERSLLVARLAQTISRRAGASKVIQEQAFLAGLLHDLGIQIMVSHDPEQYRKLLNYSVKKQKPIYLVEKAAFGFFHGEVAAALLALWNLSPQVVEAVMLHHVPHLATGTEFSPLTAVHVADAMLPSVAVNGECNLASELSIRYLDQIDVMDEVPQWRIVANEYRVRMVSNS